MKHILLSILFLTSISVTAQQTFNWSQIADYPYNAWGMNSCGYNGYLYTFSNCGGANNNLYRYDAGADKWDTLANLSVTGICNTSMAGVDGKLYIAGAGVLHVFDINSGQFEGNTVTTPGSFNQNGVVAVGVGTSLYYIGGGSTKNLYRFDASSKTFTKLADMNDGHENVQAAYKDGKIYVIGGRSNGGGLTSAEVYDIANNTWTSLTSTFAKRYFGFAFADSNYIYLMGGETGTNSFKYKTIELFDPANNTVTIMDTMTNNMNREHTAHGMGVAGGKLVAAAGFTNTPNNSTTNYCEAANFNEVTSVMKQNKESVDFKVYPNPANGVVHIQFANPKAVNTIALFNVTGQQVLTRDINERKEISIDVSTLTAGNYLLKLTGNNATQVQQLQIAK